MLRHARWLARVWLLVAAPLVVSRAAAGQDTAGVRRPPAPPADTTAGTAPVTRADSLALRTSPMNAFWRSFLLPGWGQAKLGRKLTGGIFVAWEGTTLAMSLKTRH